MVKKVSSDFLNMIHVDAEYSRIVVQFTMDEKLMYRQIADCIKQTRGIDFYSTSSLLQSCEKGIGQVT